jgi:hypothetical protein
VDSAKTDEWPRSINSGRFYIEAAFQFKLLTGPANILVENRVVPDRNMGYDKPSPEYVSKQDAIRGFPCLR